MKLLFYWPSLAQDIKNQIKECEVCQQNKGENVAYPGLLQPLLISSHAWEHITMDFISGLPRLHGKDVVLVVIDKYTKFAHCFALTHPYTANQIA